MRRRVHLDNLRKTDHVTLQVLIADALRRPIGQLAPATLADLMALSEVETLPAAMKRDLSGFALRMGQEVADIPDGDGWKEFIDELTGLEPARVPHALRALVKAESERTGRPKTTIDLANQVLSAWEETEPEPWEMGGKSVKIERAAARDPEGTTKRSRRSTATRGRTTRSSSTSSSKRSATPRKPVAPVDPEREQFLNDMVLERLAGYGEKGLAENILVMGISHRARETYADVSNQEISARLKYLDKVGSIRKSAGRWRLTNPWGYVPR